MDTIPIFRQTSFLSKAQSENLQAIGADIDLNELVTNIGDHKSIAHKLCFDFVYASAIIVGNTQEERRRHFLLYSMPQGHKQRYKAQYKDARLPIMSVVIVSLILTFL